MSESWHGRVSTYVERLAQVAETIDLILDQTRVQTVNCDSPEVEQSTRALLAAINDLETLVAERENLLKADDAPLHGLTLTDKLIGTRKIDDARLAKVCEEVSRTIDLAHERAISLFICQYHLADLGADIIRLLSGATAPKTYGDGPANSGGGLFNEAG